MESKHLRGATGRRGVGGEDPCRDQDPQKTVPSEQGEQAKHLEGRPSRISSLQGILICGGMGMLEKTLESPLDCKEIQPVHPKGNQS